MKIMILMPSLRMGGAERVAVTLSNWLAEKNNEVYLLNLSKENPCYEVSDKVHLYLNQNCIETSKNTHLKRIKAYRQREQFYLKLVKEIKPDVVFTMFSKMALLSFKYKKEKEFKDKKTVFISSERCNPKAPGVTFSRKVLTHYASLNCDGYIFQTERVKKYFLKKAQQKGIVIHNSVSNPELKNIPNNRSFENTITTMGRLTNQKGHDVMIKAFSKVCDKIPEYNLHIYGEGKERKNLENLIQSLNLENRVFLMGNDAKAILKVANSKLFLLTSRFEGMPNALMEAMACGIPCISTDCDMGPSELICHKENGILTKVDDVEGIANEILNVLTNEEYAEKLGKNAKNILETHSIDKIYNQYLEYFKTVLKNN